MQRIGNLDPLIVGRAHVVHERGDRQGVPILWRRVVFNDALAPAPRRSNCGAA